MLKSGKHARTRTGSIYRRPALAVFTVFMLLTAGIALGTVSTDQEDYSPGSVVTIDGDNSNGAGYLAGETVSVTVQGPNGYTASCEGAADEAGAWSCQVTLWDTYLAWGEYSYTATGQVSGVSESGAFTDALNTRSFASNCATAQETFTSGSTVCIKLTGLGNNASGTIKWWKPGLNPSTDTPTRSTGYGPVNGEKTDSFQVSDCGTWNVVVTGFPATGGTSDFDDTFSVSGCAPANSAPVVNASDDSFAEGMSDAYSASWSDADSGQTHTCTIDFGDGSGAVAGTVGPAQPSSSGTCSASHTYADGPNSYTIQVSVSDGIAPGSDSATATVSNVAPSVSDLTGDTPVNESSGTHLYTYAINEPGDDTVTATPECGPGNSVSDATNTNAGGSFKCTFPDGLDPAVESTVSVSATDSDGEEGNTATFGVLVNNVAPIVVAGFEAAVDCRTNATFIIDPADVGVNDSPWKVNIDWGDGTTEPEFSRTDLEPFTVTHVYTLAGTYDATVSVTDKDGATGSDPTNSVTINQTYVVDFLPPFDDSTPSGLIVNKMKNGRVVPVKVTLYDECGLASVTDPDTDVTIKLSKTSGAGTGDPVEEYADAGQSSAGTNEFRWSDDGFWIYNLDSKYLGLVVNNLYRVDVFVGPVKGTVDNWAVLQPLK